jgi:hypothetical protein
VAILTLNFKLLQVRQQEKYCASDSTMLHEMPRVAVRPQPRLHHGKEVKLREFIDQLHRTVRAHCPDELRFETELDALMRLAGIAPTQAATQQPGRAMQP